MADVVGPDAFSAALSDLLGDVKRAADDSLDEAVAHGIRTSAREWRKGAPVATGAYRASVRSRVDRRGGDAEAHAYSTKPGLPHLLEKGHAKVGGGRVAGREHIAPAAEAGFLDTWRTLNEQLDERL